MNAVDLLAQLSDMKDIDYRNTLAIASIIEILIERGIIKRNEVVIKARQLDSMSIEEIQSLRKSSLYKASLETYKFF